MVRSTILSLLVGVLAIITVNAIDQSLVDKSIKQYRGLKKDKDKKDKKEKKDKKDKDKKDEEIELFSFRPLPNFKPFENLNLKSLKSVTPKDVGHMHTVVFNEFADKYQFKDQLSSMDLMFHTREVMAAFCDKGDYLCKALSSKATVKAFSRLHSETDEEMKYPESMDEKVKNHLILAETVIDSLNEDNTDEVVEMLNTIQTDLEELEDVMPEYQSVGVAGLSVAIESTKFWSKVMKDVNHPLYSLVNGKQNEEGDKNRQLQAVGEGINITVEINWEVIFENINYVVTQTVGQAIKAVESVIDTVFVIVTNVVDMTTDAIVATISAVQSAAQAVVAVGTQVAVALYDATSQVIAATVNAGIDLTTATITAGFALFTTAAEVGFDVASSVIGGALDVVSTTAEVALDVADTAVTAGSAVLEGVVDTTILAAETAVGVGTAVLDTSVDVITTGLEAGVNAAEVVVETASNGIEAGIDVVQGAAGVVVGTVAGVAGGISRIVRADYNGATTGGAFMVEQVMSNPVLLFPLNWIPLGIVTAFWYSIPSSANSGFRQALERS